MWTSAELKERAKLVLRKYYWLAFLVSLVGSIISSIGSSSPRFNYNFNTGNTWFNNNNGWGDAINWNNLNFDIPNMISVLAGILFGATVLSGIFLFATAFAFALKIFLGGPIEAGMNRYFLETRQDRSDFVNLFYSFRSGRYLNIVKAIAWRELFTFLWTLLFIIPGIVKRYAYSMIPYLMADNPGMDYKRAMELSKAMTYGEKGNIFVLDLSFIGWYLLGLLACCVGVVFLNPYYFATKAELYVTLRRKAIDASLCTAEEVGL